MFNPQMSSYIVSVPTTTKNIYNEDIVNYSTSRVIEMAVSEDTRAMYQSNDSNITNLNLIGITRDRQINKDDKVGSYIVDFVEQARLYTIVHMREIDNDGRYTSRI